MTLIFSYSQASDGSRLASELSSNLLLLKLSHALRPSPQTPLLPPHPPSPSPSPSPQHLRAPPQKLPYSQPCGPDNQNV